MGRQIVVRNRRARRALRPIRGYVLWRGESALDGAPIAVVATLRSKNVKTGRMVQTFIMRTDVDPMTAVRKGRDASICGNCRYRPSQDGGCYVTVGRAPLQVFRALKRRRYPRAPEQLLGSLDRPVRLGTYGDPAAVPFEVWDRLMSGVKKWTGYTHQWRDCDPRFKSLLMASVDTPEEKVEADALGWRTFRTRADADALLFVDEIVCPASKEAGYISTCIKCGLCNGARRQPDKRRSIAIIVHGLTANRARRSLLRRAPPRPSRLPIVKT